LGAEPRDLAFPVHPFVDVGLASEAGDSLGAAPSYSATIIQSSSELRIDLNVTFAFAMQH
jgi:hypothetical protein